MHCSPLLDGLSPSEENINPHNGEMWKKAAKAEYKPLHQWKGVISIDAPMAGLTQITWRSWESWLLIGGKGARQLILNELFVNYREPVR